MIKEKKTRSKNSDDWFYTADAEGNVMHWSLKSLTCKKSYKLAEEIILCIQVTFSKKYLLISTSRMIKIFKISEGNILGGFLVINL